jgi:hypothetical protein
MRVKTSGCKPGDLIAIPLGLGGWAVALVVRQAMDDSKRPPHAIRTYGFGKLFDKCPTLEEAMGFRVTDAVCFDFSSDFQVWAGVWPKIGALPDFSEADWPLPPLAGTVEAEYGEPGERLVVHLGHDSGDTSTVVGDATGEVIRHDEYCQLPHRKGLGDAAWLAVALNRAIHEHHPFHYYPVTEERMNIWKRVVHRIITHKPELAKIGGPWYTGIEAVATEELLSRAANAKVKSKVPAKGARARTTAGTEKGSGGKARTTKAGKKNAKKVVARRRKEAS